MLKKQRPPKKTAPDKEMPAEQTAAESVDEVMGAGAADDATLRAALHRDGVHSLQHAGLAKVIEGTTSLKELAHVLKIGT